MIVRCLTIAALLTLAPLAHAWHEQGHETIARQAVALLPGCVPEFFRQGAAQVAFGAMDADLFKHPALPALTRTESPEHFVNLELLDGMELPATRQEFEDRLRARGRSGHQVGYLPYAIVEWTQRLAVAFAEHRRWPNDPRVEAKALVYAGVLSHYSGDLAMPLHTTADFDGRQGPDGRSPRSGIHQRLDALLDKLPLDDPRWLEGLTPRDFSADLLQGVVAALETSHARVERVYALETEIPAMSATRVESAAVRELGRDSYRQGVELTASLFLTAWELSGQMSLPAWRVGRQNESQRMRSNC